MTTGLTLSSLRYLAIGMGITVGLALEAILLSALIGLCVALVRLYGWRPLRTAVAAWVAIVRGVPLLLLLVGFYSSLPYLGVDLPLHGVVIVVMGAYFGAYMGEVFRGAIMSVPRAQWDAGRSVGFLPWQIFFVVVLPQARRLCVAPFLNTALTVVKNTSLVSAIGGWELVAAGREIGERTGDLLPVYGAIAAAYFAICWPLSRLATSIERASLA